MPPPETPPPNTPPPNAPPPDAPPPANETLGGNGNGTGTGGGGDGEFGAPVVQPDTGEVYRWFSGNFTNLYSTWSAALRVALNEVDFRGRIPFVYYHQVVTSIAVVNSTEYQMFSTDGSSAFAGGSPRGGYPITIVGSGFDGYDQNASTVRVRFTTELQSRNSSSALANGTAPASDINGTASSSDNATSTIEVAAYELLPNSVVVLAPRVSKYDGDVQHERGYPCWNPPCRRTVVTLAINGLDFVGRSEPLEFYFFDDPWRFLNLMERELVLFIIVLCALALINALITWKYRFEVYDRYLAIKYKIKNRVIYPIMFK
jgi:hypothetical protein